MTTPIKHDRRRIHWQLLFESIASLTFGFALLGLFEGTTAGLVFAFGLYFIFSGCIALGQLLFSHSQNRFELMIRVGLGFLAVLLIFADQGRLLSMLPEFFGSLGGSRTLMRLTGALGVAIGLTGIIQMARGGGWIAGLIGIAVVLASLMLFRIESVGIGRLFNILPIVAILAGGLGIFAALFGGSVKSSPVVALFRLLGIISIMLLGLGVAFVAWVLPFRRNGLKLHFSVLQSICRNILSLLNIRVTCPDASRIQEHRGILFVNHLSYLDIPVVLSISPARFLSTSEVFQIPFVGWFTSAIDTLFVKRGDRKSGRDVRDQIGEQLSTEPYPPFIIFPEGKFGTPQQLAPFRYGSFETAAQHEIPYLLCALMYAPVDVAFWKGKNEESFFAAVWRVLRYRPGMEATLTPVIVIQPKPTDQRDILALQAQEIIATELGQ